MLLTESHGEPGPLAVALREGRPSVKTGAAVAPDRPGERFYRPELDGLRFLAFLAVFLAHVFQGEWVATGPPIDGLAISDNRIVLADGVDACVGFGLPGDRPVVGNS